MDSFKRIFKYVWPQWPSIITVVVSAVIVAALLSLSLMTVIPLLDVMMRGEGLHGWIDRKACLWKYGTDFSVPDAADIIGNGNQSLGYYLLVTNVEENSLAEAAGLKLDDKIVGVRAVSPTYGPQEIPFSQILQTLAAATESRITLQLKRLNQNNTLEDITIDLITPNDKPYLESLPWSRAKRMKYGIKLNLIERAQWTAAFLPREKTQDNTTRAVIYIILAVGILTVIRCLAKFYQSYMAQKVVQIGINQLREDAFNRVMDLPMGFFAGERPSDAVSRIVRDTSVMGKAIKIMLGKALREPLNALFMLGAAMLLNWQLTLIFLCAAPLVLGLVAVLGRKMKKATKKSLVVGSQMLGKLQGTMAGLRVVKVYNQQEHERQAFKNINNKLLKQLLKISKVDALTMPVLEVLGMLAGSAALIIGVHWVSQNRMKPEEFLALLLLLGAAAECIRKTSDIWNKIQEANAAAERVFAIIDQPAENETPNAFDLTPLADKIEFVNVVFTYPAANEPVLKGIDLTVPAGHNVAIVGPNGSGKTTLANLIPRFFDPDSGSILIDGQNIHDATFVSLRSQIAMVTQDVVTFNDTIAANIAYGKPDADRKEIVAAAKRSFAHEFIAPLPEGYDTIIGEYGAGLSGGQLQRIVIARAILKNPAILIFDEATSQVDADSEAKIHKALEKIMQDRTSFVIAHRFSTVINADVIVVMDNGRIIAQGQHEELIQICPLYQSLYETQLVKA